jgi:hypothetical protein
MSLRVMLTPRSSDRAIVRNLTRLRRCDPCHRAIKGFGGPADVTPRISPVTGAAAMTGNWSAHSLRSSANQERCTHVTVKSVNRPEQSVDGLDPDETVANVCFPAANAAQSRAVMARGVVTTTPTVQGAIAQLECDGGYCRTDVKSPLARTLAPRSLLGTQSHVGCCPLVSSSTIVFACSMLKPYSFRAM